MKRLRLPFRRRPTPSGTRPRFTFRTVPTNFYDRTLEQQLEWAREFLQGIAPVPPENRSTARGPSDPSPRPSAEKGTP